MGVSAVVNYATPRGRGALQGRRVPRRAPLGSPPRAAAAPAATAPVEAVPEERWLAAALGCAPTSGAPALAGLQAAGREQLLAARLPSSRDEGYRFTDMAPLLESTLVAPGGAGGEVAAAAEGVHLSKGGEPGEARLVFVDGAYDPGLSDTGSLPEGVSVSPASALEAAPGSLGAQQGRSGVLGSLNAAAAPDAAVVSVGAGVAAPGAVHVLYLSTGGGSGAGECAASYPRLAVEVGAGGSVTVVEEFAGAGEGGRYYTGACAEFDVGEGAEVSHTLVQRQAGSAVHTRQTLVRQAEGSRYDVTEVGVGAQLARHDLDVVQLGPRTFTGMKHFYLAGAGQLLDLHSKLLLEHPEGEADQLHKCIVAHGTGRGVFDGNVRVEREAQQTDAKQLTRNLLLVPKATVNVKPNLQIVADDVKCTHGCTVSDLEEEELFYFQSRGLDAAKAREALVQGFALEVVQGIQHAGLKGRAEDIVRKTLLQALAEA